MLSIIKRIWPSTKKDTNTSSLKPQQPLQEGILSEMLYLSIDELPLQNFINCVCDEDLSSLVKSGNPPKEILTAVWNEIYEQYVIAIKDKEQAYIIRLNKEINALEFDLKLFNLCVRRLEIEHSDEVLEALKKVVPVSEKFNPNDLEQYKKDLNLAITRSKRLVIEIENKKGELSKITPKKGERMSKIEFDKVIIRVSKYMQYKIDKKTTTVSEFVQMVDDMRQEADMIEKLKTKK